MNLYVDLREQWGVLVFSPKRACLAYARLAATRTSWFCELSLRRWAPVLSESLSR